MDADLSARVNASVDVELQLVAVLQLEAEARPLLLQAAPVQDGIDAFLSLSSCLCPPVQDGNLVAQDLRLVHVVR